jgi:high-affinity nickel permease
MKEFDLEEYNELCAEFMGTKHVHSDWNWIMEIVGKIETLFDGFVLFNIEDENCFVAVTGVRNYHNYTTMATKKEAAVHAIWHFLNWYKENKS